MTTLPAVERVRYIVGGGDLAESRLNELAELYEADFVDPPLKGMPFYSARRFKERLTEQYLLAPNFKVVLALGDKSQLVAFVYGCSLPASAPWWKDVSPPLLPHVTRETGDRTFAILDMLVARDLRGQKIASGLHTRLLEGRTEERITLLSSPPQMPAYAMWLSWGYQKAGELKPEQDANVLHVFLRPMPAQAMRVASVVA